MSDARMNEFIFIHSVQQLLKRHETSKDYSQAFWTFTRPSRYYCLIPKAKATTEQIQFACLFLNSDTFALLGLSQPVFLFLRAFRLLGSLLDFLGERSKLLQVRRSIRFGNMIRV